MKFENFATPVRSSNWNSPRPQSHSQSQQKQNSQQQNELFSPLTNANLRRQRHSGPGAGIGGGGFFAGGLSDKDSVCSFGSIRGKRIRGSRNIPMKSSKSVMKKTKVMDYTNYAYNEAVGRLKLMLADSYATPVKSSFGGTTYLRNFSEDSADNFSDNLSVIERPVYSDISKYLSPSQKSRFGPSYRSRKPLSGFSTSKENLALPTHYQTMPTAAATIVPPLDYLVTPKPQLAADSVQAPVEIFNFIEKQEDYIEQLEKESKYCRNELTNLLGKVKDVINENEQLTETARSELAALHGTEKSKPNLSPSSEDSEVTVYANIKKPSTPRKKETIKSPRYANAPSIVYEARISELEAELTQANIDLKRLRTENEELKRKLAHADPIAAITGQSSGTLVSVVNCDTHRKQIEHLQLDKAALEETIRQLHKSLDEAKSQQYTGSTKRYFNDLLQMERSQAELEVKHLRDELDRQHERVRELQHEMARRIADERANAERRYNTQVDQLGGDLSNQWEQVAKLQLDLERQKRYETDLKRDLSNRNAQIEELKMELRSNRSTFLADMAQTNAEKQSLEQEITALRLQLDRAAREGKTEAARYNAELNSLRQRLDRGDADLLHSKREVLRLNDEIANLEKELAYGEMKNEIRPTKKDLDKRISELQDKHADTVNELEQMIQNQKQLMDKLTTECKMLTNKLEDTTLKHNQDKQRLRDTNTQLLDRLKQIWASYKDLISSQRQTQKRRHSFSSLSSGDNSGTTNREEHFSEHKPILIKPLSTTSRPCLMQPTPISQAMAIAHAVAPPIWPTTTASHLAPTITMPCSEKPQVPATYLEQQQLLQRLQQRLLTTSMAAPRNMSQAPMPSVITKLVTANMDSAIMTTKISRTTLEQAKNNNYSNQQSMAVVASVAVSPAILPQPAMSLAKTKSPIQQPQQQRCQQHSTPIWAPPVLTAAVPASAPQRQSPTTVQPTMAPMKATIPHSTMPAPMTQAPTISHSMTAVSMPAQALMMPLQHRATIPMPVTATMAQATTIPLPISNTTQQQWTQRLQQQQHQQQPKALSHHHQHQHRQQRLRLLASEESPRSQRAAQEQKAEHNRVRAQELWGRQVLLEVENPRPPLKSNYVDSDELNLQFDPLELELSISSPSLLRSSLDSDSDRTIEVAEPEFDSISNMSISPAPTAIRRWPVTSQRSETKPLRGVNTL